MKMLVIGLHDDNYGDMLIRTNFIALLKVAIRNLGVKDLVEIDHINLKAEDKSAVKAADCVIFAGGGIFGLNYLELTKHVIEYVELAAKCDIPVYFSSLGVINLDKNDENMSICVNLLNNKAIRMISLREHKNDFMKYVSRDDLSVEEVSDPAVWTRYAYAKDLDENNHEQKCVGVNVVRGGLFMSNDNTWKLKDEMEYLTALKSRLDEAGIRSIFYSNGNVLDDNALVYWASETPEVNDSDVVTVTTSRELVRTINRFDAIASMRLHSSILAYSMGIPAINIVWSKKVTSFYEIIGRPERAISEAEWTADRVFKEIQGMLEEGRYEPDHDYMMTVYDYIVRIIRDAAEVRKANAGAVYEAIAGCNPEIYTFSQVAAALASDRIPEEEDHLDRKRKLIRSMNSYFTNFHKVKEQGEKIKALEREINQLDKAVSSLNDRIEAYKKMKGVRIQKKLERMLRIK